MTEYNEYTTDRIRGMTEHEMVRALCTQRITSEQITAAWGECLLSSGVIEEYESYKFSCENTDIYWDKKISNLREQLQQLEAIVMYAIILYD